MATAVQLQLSAATLDISGGKLTYTAAGGIDNNLSITKASSNYVFTETAETITLTAAATTAGWTGSGTTSVTGPISSVSAGIFVNLLTGNDTLNVNTGITVSGAATFRSGQNITITNATITAGSIALQGDTGLISETGTGSLQTTGGLLLFSTSGSASLNGTNNVAQLAATFGGTGTLGFTNSGDLTVTSVSSVDLGVTSFGTLSPGATAITVNSGNLSLLQNVQSSTATVTLTVPAGSVTSGGGAVVATSTALSANTGIGTSLSLLPLQVSNIVARNTASGGIFVNNTTGALTIGFAGDPFQGVIDSGGSGDQIILQSAGNVNVTTNAVANEIISAPGNVAVTAVGPTSDVVTGESQNTQANASNALKGSIVSVNGTVTVTAGRDLLFGSTALGNVLAAGSLVLNAGRDIILDAATRAGANAFATSSGPLNATAGRNISVLHAVATGAIFHTFGAQAISLTAGPGGTFTGSNGQSFGDIESNGGNVTITADGITLNDINAIEANGATVTLQPASANTPINLGTKPANTLGLQGNELSSINTNALIIGSANPAFSNTVTVSTNVNIGPPNVTIRMAGGFAGTGSPGLALSNPGSLTLTDTGNTAHTWNAGPTSINGVALSNISTLTINGGGGSDTFNVSPSSVFGTNVNGNSPTLGTAFPGDALNVSLTGLTNPTLSVTSNGSGLSGGYTLGGGFQPVSFAGIESGVLLPPTLAKAFGTNPVALNGTTNLTFTVSHSNLQPIGGGNSLTVSGLANLTGVSFSDALPAGLAVASPLSVTGACSGSVTNGANALAPGNTNIVLTGGVVPLNGTCAITVAVTPTTAGAKTNITSVITALESGPGVTTGTATLTVLPSVTINAPAITYGANGVVTVTVSANTAPTPTGNVTLTVDGGAGVVHALAGGVATFTVTAPAVGGHPLTVIYAGDGNYGAVPQSGTLSGTLTVNKAPLTVTADNKTITYGTSPAFTATISGFVNGDTAAVVSGAASFSTNATLTNGNPNAGSWTITPAAGTLAATNYTFTTFANGALTVNKANLSVTANNPTITYGAALPASSVTFGGFVNGDTAAVVSGTAAFSTNATLTNGNPNAGSWTITPAAGTLTAANYTFTPFVGGALTVNKANLSVTSSNATITYGAALPASSVTFSGFVNGDTAAVVSGAASFSTNATLTNGNPNAGSWTITPAAGTLAAANYTFTPFNNGALTVNKVNLSVTANNASKSFGATLPAFSAAITGFVNGDTLSVVSGSPSFSTTATVASSPGNYPITPAVGTLSAANYTFTTFVAGSLTVGKGNTTTVLTNSGSSLIATIVPGASGLPSPTGTVQFLNGGSVVGSVTVAGGTATFSQTSGTITAVYSGDNNYVASTSNPVTLGTPTPPATSSLSLSSSLNPSSSGQAVTFVANLSTGGPSAVPTGTVVFLDGTTSLGTRPISSSQASFTSSSLSSGTHTITAQYSGDNTFPAAQASLVQTVNGTVTMTVSASPSAAVFGQAVTLTANVSAGSGSAGLAAPTGQVTFTIPGSTFFGSSITLGTATLSSGAATINTTTLPLGTTIITAQYSGDSSWSAASRTVTVAVTQASTTTAISLTMSSGQLALTAVVGAVAPGGGTPTGSVQFTDTADNSVIATANLTAGRASAPLAASAASSVIGHSIVAVYSGDANFKTSTSPALPTIVSAAANLSANVAGDEIVSIFGLTGLNGDTAATLPLTTSLGGVTVNVTDSAGTSQLALLYGVFASAGQINFLIPGGLASGLATVVITLPGGGTVTLVTNIAGAAPGIFTASMTGQGVYAGQVIFAHSDGSQTVGNPAVMNPGSTTFTPGPINLGTPGDQVYLVLYGTGIRHAGSVTAAINGVNVPVTYFGAQGAYAGLDQMNLGPVPKSLIGAGQVNLVITADSHAANTVTLAFQ